jgi:hypothetical protein
MKHGIAFGVALIISASCSVMMHIYGVHSPPGAWPFLLAIPGILISVWLMPNSSDLFFVGYVNCIIYFLSH